MVLIRYTGFRWSVTLVKILDLVNIFSVEVDRASVVAVRKLNEKIAGDDRVRAVMMNIGDGYTLVTKQ